MKTKDFIPVKGTFHLQIFKDREENSDRRLHR
jgi:hypothetical protein